MEYKISKFILMQFICSAPVLAAAEGHTFIILQILCFWAASSQPSQKQKALQNFYNVIIMTLYFRRFRLETCNFARDKGGLFALDVSVHDLLNLAEVGWVSNPELPFSFILSYLDS